jgi:hypothetical protein
MPQFARPSADTVRTAWTDQAGGTTDIYTTIDEATPDDADYIKTAAPPGTNEFETLLTPVTDPVVDTGHVIRWRRRKQPATGSAQVNLTVRLLQGTTQITSRADNDIPGTFTTSSYTLTTAEAGGITNYSDLRLEFVATQV